MLHLDEVISRSTFTLGAAKRSSIKHAHNWSFRSRYRCCAWCLIRDSGARSLRRARGRENILNELMRCISTLCFVPLSSPGLWSVQDILGLLESALGGNCGCRRRICTSRMRFPCPARSPRNAVSNRVGGMCPRADTTGCVVLMALLTQHANLQRSRWLTGARRRIDDASSDGSHFA